MACRTTQEDTMFTSAEIQSLNELEMSVYNYVTAHQEETAQIHIRELAAAAHVSTSTVLRFCKKMGCESFSEFKVCFKQYRRSMALSPRNYDGSEIREFFHRIETASFQSRMEQISHVLRQAKTVIFVGVGNSAMTSQYAARYFANAGKFSVCITDPFNPIGVDQRLDIIVVAISVSGETKETIEIVNRFKMYDIPIASITMSDNCTLARMSDYNLSCYVSQVKKGTVDMTTQVPFLYLIEQLGARQQDK